jgi:hypothetical protein
MFIIKKDTALRATEHTNIFLGGIGSIHINKTFNKVNYSVDSNKDFTNWIIHLDKYTLLTQKAADFMLFKEVVELMKNKVHLSIEGLKQIINIKASMNLGLSDVLNSEFIDFTPVKRHIIKTENITLCRLLIELQDLLQVKGVLMLELLKRCSTYKIGHRVQWRFRISQHERDLNLMKYLAKYLGSGKVYKYSEKPAVVLTIFQFSDITNIII